MFGHKPFVSLKAINVMFDCLEQTLAILVKVTPSIR